jgi:Tol biopolymer transport system component
VSEADHYNCTPDWTPDSTALVYARGIVPNQPGRAELWMAYVDGTARRRIYREEERHIYGACVSPDGHYVVFTGSDQDLGEVPDIEMALIRLSGTAEVTPSSRVTRLDLGPGWEPHWTAAHIFP